MPQACPLDDVSPAVDRRRVAEPLSQADSVTAYAFRVSRQLTKCRREGGQLALLWLEIDLQARDGGNLTDDVRNGLIQIVSLRLRNRVRGSDDVQRVGAQGFAVLLDAGATEANIVRKRLLETLRGIYDLDGLQAEVSLRVGTAVFPQDGRNGAELAESASCGLGLAS